MNTRKSTRVICIVLAALLVFSLLAAAISSSAMAVSQSDIDALKDKKSNLGTEQKQIQSQISDLEGQQASVLEKKEALDKQNELARQEIELIDEQIAIYDGLIENKAKDLEDATQAEQEQYEKYRTRMRAMEENGNWDYLSILFGATSFSDLLSRIDFVSEIMQYDTDLEASLTETRKNLETAKAEYEDMQTQNEELKTELAAKKEDLENQVSEACAMIADLENDIDAYTKAYEENEAAEKALDTQIENMIATLEAEKAAAEKAAQEAAANNGGTSGGTTTPSSNSNAGGFIWPTTSTVISSQYGYRIHPIFHTKKLHAGVDISAGAGQPIYAAAAGTVTVAVYSSSYGNYVMINHNNGYYTLYAHMTSYIVSQGQSVSQGQVIGYVGSTGYSTGPHLHFEVRNSSGTMNPLSFF